MGKNKKTKKPTAFNRIIPPIPVLSAARKPSLDPVLEYLQRDRTIKPWDETEEHAGSRDASGRNPFQDPPKTSKWESFANQSVEDKLIAQNNGPVTARCTKIKKEKPRRSETNPFRLCKNVKNSRNLAKSMTEKDKNIARQAIGFAARRCYGAVPLNSLEDAVRLLAKRVDRQNR